MAFPRCIRHGQSHVRSSIEVTVVRDEARRKRPLLCVSCSCGNRIACEAAIPAKRILDRAQTPQIATWQPDCLLSALAAGLVLEVGVARSTDVPPQRRDEAGRAQARAQAAAIILAGSNSERS